ncbi:hypothetical protein [Saccharopolyspora hattusasensis]|uniref:hypothetical protein n=1 Tax=Saccharopolyspora hattusasensis TaxID=1128679 RepID=UPI003D982907
MIIEVLPRPQVHRVWIWNGTNTTAIREHLAELGRDSGNVVDFIDNGDQTATVRSATQRYGTYEFPVYQGEWYATQITYMGVVPEMRSVEQINTDFVAYPDYTVPIDPAQTPPA